MPTDSKALSVREIRERIAIMEHDTPSPSTARDLRRLLANIDAATPAMADQERRAESWNKIADFVAARSLMLLEQQAKDREHAEPT